MRQLAGRHIDIGMFKAWWDKMYPRVLKVGVYTQSMRYYNSSVTFVLIIVMFAGVEEYPERSHRYFRDFFFQEAKVNYFGLMMMSWYVLLRHRVIIALGQTGDDQYSPSFVLLLNVEMKQILQNRVHQQCLCTPE